jgi:hypothetical protein
LTTDIPATGPPLHQALYAGVETRYEVPVAGRRLLASRQPLLRIARQSGACE